MPEAANLLRKETSPYLLQHADNPVHWRPWGPAALREAAEADKPILLSIGYAACHWCHVMAHESFEDPETAAVMNARFVSIKVDREERPDIDHLYMSALHALGEQGGWPLTMFLAPDGTPFWGGTYFPPEPRWGRPSFRQVLQGVASAYRERDKVVTQNTGALRDYLQRVSAPQQGAQITPAHLDAVAKAYLGMIDQQHGGL
ncbi:MAG: thioredoxin domain-containing protein, partial [Alphaproteobacteria bacterium]|nr:thioredoxin domain-containing protein [Alphaproteobacteria bacterium]